MSANPCVVPPERDPDIQRGKVKKLTWESMRRLAFVANNTAADFRSMFTLTYHPEVAPKDGQISKKHLNSFLQSLRRRDVLYLWFMEFQQNDSVHYHILTTQEVDSDSLASKAVIDKARSTRESARWAAIVGGSEGDFSESSPLGKMIRACVRVEPVRTTDGAARYATKYAYKEAQKEVPEGFQNCGRFWGCSRGLKPVPISHEKQVGTEGLQTFEAPCFGEAGERLEGIQVPYKIQFNSVSDQA